MYSLTLNTQDEIAAVKAQIENPPQGGFDLDGMKAALALSSLLDGAAPGEPLMLEDKHYSQLQRRMKDARWVRATSDLIDLVERFLNAPRVIEPKT